MEALSTGLRALFTRRLDAKTVFSYALLLGLLVAVVALGWVIVADQFAG